MAHNLIRNASTPASMTSEGAFRSRLRSRLFILALAAVFFVPWGEGLKVVSAADAPKAFIILAVIVTMGMAVTLRLSDQPYNTLLRYWLIYMLLHTLIVYGIWKPEQLQWGMLGTRELAGGATKLQEGTGLRIARFFLFASFGGALSVLARPARAKHLILISYVAGLNCVMILGGYQLSADPTTVARLAGGSLDPNAFGLSCAIGLASCVCLLAEHTRAKATRILTVILTPALVVGLIASGSRGSVLGIVAGLSTTLLLSRSRAKLGIMVGAGVAVIIIAAILMPSDVRNAARERFSLNSISSDRGSSRPELWQSYISALPHYAISGTGMHLGPSAISQSWDTPRMTHNVYLQLLVENGAIGLLLFLAGIIAIFRRLLRSTDVGQAAVAGMLATWLVASFFLDSFNIRDTWLVLAVACSAVSTAARGK